MAVVRLRSMSGNKGHILKPIWVKAIGMAQRVMPIHTLMESPKWRVDNAIIGKRIMEIRMP